MTTPQVTELVTLDDVLAHLNLPDDSSIDVNEVQGFIDAATAYIQNMTGPIIPQTFTETHDGGAPTICVFNPPILSVTSVTEYLAATGYTLTQVNLGDATGQYSFSVDSPNSGVIRRRYSGGLSGMFAGGVGNVAVTYVAGRAAVPADIRMAVLQDLAGMFQTSQLGPGSAMFPNSMGDGNRPNPVGMFPRVAEILSAPTMRVPGIG